MGRLWSLLFLMVPIFGVLVFLWAIADWWPMKGHWLPENVNDYGGVIDNLFIFILWITGIIFVGTSLALFWFLWKYDAAVHQGPVQYTHGSHTLEIVWSVLPAAALLFIAIFQMSAWADAKMKRPLLSKGEDGLEGTADDVLRPPLVEVTGRQFEWRIRYPGQDGELGTADDILTVNDLHLPYGEDIVIAIKSQDVLHSFFLPNMRVKQDVVPGMKQFVWFRIKPPKSTETQARTYDIVCAELCGWGHYKMRGRMYVESRAEFDRWLAAKWESQNQASFTKVAAEGE